MVLHCYRIASGNSLIHDRTGVRSDDVTTHPPQRTRPDKAGFAAFWPRRNAKGIPAYGKRPEDRTAGIPGSYHSRLVKPEDTPRSERGSWGFESLTGHEDVLYILCFQHKTSCPEKGKHEERPNVSDQMRVSPPHGAVALRSRYAAAQEFCSSPLEELVRIQHLT